MSDKRFGVGTATALPSSPPSDRILDLGCRCYKSGSITPAPAEVDFPGPPRRPGGYDGVVAARYRPPVVSEPLAMLSIAVVALMLAACAGPDEPEEPPSKDGLAAITER